MYYTRHTDLFGAPVYPAFYYCCEHCRTPCSYGPKNHMTQCGWAGCTQGKKAAK